MDLSIVVTLLAAFGCSQASAHGRLVRPKAMFIDNVDVTQFSSTIESVKIFPNGIFNTDPTTNVNSFVEHYKKSKYHSLKELIVKNQVLVSPDATLSCGFTAPEKASYGALNDTVYWGRNDDITLDEGINHPGVCEFYCDDNQVQQDMNCQETFKPPSGKGASPIPIDTSLCKTAKRFTSYWIAMHGPIWQVYVNCIDINGGTEGAESTSSSNTQAAKTPSKTTPAVTPTTVSTTGTIPTSVAKPSMEPIANETSTSTKCSRRRVRS